MTEQEQRMEARTMQALVYTGGTPAVAVQNVPVPDVHPGAAVVKILATNVSPGSLGAMTRAPLLTPPFTLGQPCIGRIYATGSDATTLHAGQLVFVDLLLMGRDDPDVTAMRGYIHSGPGSNGLAEHWQYGTMAEYALVPLENLYVLDEELLIGKLGYSIPDLVQIAYCVISIAGLMDCCELRPGDTVIVAPATGRFSGNVVQMALAMGARVVAAGRTQESLDGVKKLFDGTEMIVTLKLTGDEERDTVALKEAAGGKGADAFVDMSPTRAKVKHIASCIKALKKGGKAAFLGGDVGTVEIPYMFVMLNNIRIQGRYLNGREHFSQTMKLVEAGLLKLGAKLNGDFKVWSGLKLTDVDKADQINKENPGFGTLVVIEP